jgi:hypothetical protein
MATMVLFNFEASMNRLIRASAFGAILWHMLAGCCMHHAHADSLCDCGSAPAVEQAHACDCHHDDQDHGQHGQDPRRCDSRGEHHQHHGHHGRCSQNCSFVVPDPQTTVKPEPAISPLGDIPFAGCADFHAQNDLGQNNSLGHSPPIRPDRLNAVLQVFLL